MAHEIDQHDVTVFGNNTPAWHGLGTVFPGLMSPLRVFAEGVGMREITESAVYTASGMPVTGYKALTGLTAAGVSVPLSVVGEDYSVLQDQKTFELLEALYSGQAVVETAGTLRNGRRLWILVKRKAWSVITGDPVVSYDLWVNRHDSSGCFELHRVNVRVVCANTLKMAIGKGRNRVFGVKHTSGMDRQVAHAMSLLQVLANEEESHQRQVIKLSQTLMSHSEAKAFLNELFEIRVDQEIAGDVATRTLGVRDECLRLFHHGAGNHGRTRWDALNGVTEFVDHHRSVRTVGGRNRAEVRMESSLFGTGDDLKDRAFALLAV